MSLWAGLSVSVMDIWLGFFGSTAVVLDTHVNLRIDQVGGDVHWLLGVDRHSLVLCSVVGGACGYPQLILLVQRGHDEF